jgi:hypothetical protein
MQDDNIGKLNPQWKGPFHIIKRNGKNVIARNVFNLGDIKTVHINDCKIQAKKDDSITIERMKIPIWIPKRIIKTRVKENHVEYLVEWNESDIQTWENINVLPETLISEYNLNKNESSDVEPSINNNDNQDYANMS